MSNVYTIVSFNSPMSQRPLGYFINTIATILIFVLTCSLFRRQACWRKRSVVIDVELNEASQAKTEPIYAFATYLWKHRQNTANRNLLACFLFQGVFMLITATFEMNVVKLISLSLNGTVSQNSQNHNITEILTVSDSKSDIVLGHFTGRFTDQLSKLALNLFGWMICGELVRFISMRITHYFSINIIEPYRKSLRRSAVEALSRLDPEYVNSKYSDTRDFDQAISEGDFAIDNILCRVPWMIDHTMSILRAFYFLACQSIISSALIVLSIVPIALYAWKNNSRFRQIRDDYSKLARKQNKEIKEVNSTLTENYIAGSTKRMVDKFDMMHDIRTDSLRQMNLQGINSDQRVMSLIRVFGLISVGWVIYSKSYPSIPAIYAFVMAIENALMRVGWLVHNATGSAKSLEKWKLIAELLGKAEIELFTPSSPPFDLTGKTLILYGLKKRMTKEETIKDRYKVEKKIVKEFIFDVCFENGLMLTTNINTNTQSLSPISFIGKSGNGKTTFLLILAGKIIPDELKVSVDGVEITDRYFFNNTQRRSCQIQFLSCLKTEFDPEWAIDEYITWGKDVSADECNRMFRLAEEFQMYKALFEVEDKAPISDLEKSKLKIGTLSEGEGKRLRLMRFFFQMIKFPMLLLSDEPENGLGVLSTAIIRAMEKHVKHSGCMVFTSHIERQQLMNIGVRVVEMSNGKNVVCDEEKKD